MDDLAAADSLTSAFRARVQALHERAERCGIVADLLRGRASVAGYALLLRNLLPAYRSLEQCLDQHRRGFGPMLLANPGLYRSAAIEADLAVLCGAEWRAVPTLAAATRYAARIEAVSGGDGARLIAHAYTRYLGDLSGGRILRRLLADRMGVPAAALTFYAFPELGDLGAFKAALREAMDRAGRRLADPEAVVEEAAIAFELNIDLSLAVQQAAILPAACA